MNYDLHFHKNFELIYAISGQIRCVVGEKEAILSAGDYALCLSNEIHSIASIGESKCWIGVFSGDFVHAFEKQVKNKTGDKFVFRCSEKTNAFLVANLISEKEPPLYILKGCLYTICQEFCNQVNLSERTNKSDLLMHKIIEYLSQNYQEHVTLSDVSEQLGYDYYYLSKCFRKIFRMSFTDLLNSYRLDAALRLLTETDKDITEIALESGFQSVRNFNDYFKLKIGSTPSKYKKYKL